MALIEREYLAVVHPGDTRTIKYHLAFFKSSSLSCPHMFLFLPAHVRIVFPVTRRKMFESNPAIYQIDAFRRRTLDFRIEVSKFDDLTLISNIPNIGYSHLNASHERLERLV